LKAAQDPGMVGEHQEQALETEREIAQRLLVVRERIALAAQRSGRKPDSVTLVAVSKTQAPAAVRAAYRAGVRDFGENYVQEAASKRAALRDLVDARWHLVGHLQSNKAAQALDCFEMIHSLDSARLATRLARLRPRKTPRVLVQVNLSGEVSKSGIASSELEALLVAVRGVIAVSGLMTIPAPAPTPEHSRGCFARLRALRDALARSTGLELRELSMGMSDDFEVAIEEGATIVRIGRAIFGERMT
jgi:pyridoxal phosphate enzyme (YggS family)